jgi:predicted nucleic acid-binding protein
VDAKICVDASFALKLVLPEADSDLAQSEWQNWLHSGVELTAPDLFTYETTSVLRNRVFRKEITQSEADEALEILGGLEITYHQPAPIRQLAWDLARGVNRPTAYDAFYLALHSRKVARRQTSLQRSEEPAEMGSRFGTIAKCLASRTTPSGRNLQNLHV